MKRPPIPYDQGSVQLPDRRRLSYAQFGDPAGAPVFWFHGSPGSSTQLPPDADRVALRFGLRLVGVDRPGMGGSTRFDQLDLLSFTKDVRSLAHALQVERFGLIGLSGGALYALACAHEMPGSVVMVATLGCPAPIFDEYASHAPPSWGVAAGHVLKYIKRPGGWLLSAVVFPLRPFVHQALAIVQRVWWEADRRVFQDPAFARMFAESILVATQNGIHGVLYDYAAFARPWGFSVRDIKVPVRMWHGELDPFVPLYHANILADLIPDTRLVVQYGEGHLAGFCRVEEVLETVGRYMRGGRTGDEGANHAGPDYSP